MGSGIKSADCPVWGAAYQLSVRKEKQEWSCSKANHSRFLSIPSAFVLLPKFSDSIQRHKIFYILVKRIRLYDIRHFHATMPVEMGVFPLEIADGLGNKKIETTLNTYSHLYPNKRTALADKLNEKYKEALCSWNMENEISYE